MPAPEMRNGPASAGRPTTSDRAAPGTTMLGPATAPMVTAHTTRDRSRPRRSGRARSVAAKRAWRFTAEPRPTRKAPATSSGNDRHTVAATIIRVPSVAPARPVVRASRRPRRTARVDSGIASRAGASVMAVVVAPANPSRPERSTARIEPSASVEPLPSALKTCARVMVRTVRRWTASMSTSAEMAGRAMGRDLTGLLGQRQVHRCDGSTADMTLSTCSPQPVQVVLPQVSHRMGLHMVLLLWVMVGARSGSDRGRLTHGLGAQRLQGEPAAGEVAGLDPRSAQDAGGQVGAHAAGAVDAARAAGCGVAHLVEAVAQLGVRDEQCALEVAGLVLRGGTHVEHQGLGAHLVQVPGLPLGHGPAEDVLGAEAKHVHRVLG